MARRIYVGQRVVTDTLHGRAIDVSDQRENHGDYMWKVRLDRAVGREQHEEMFFEKNLQPEDVSSEPCQCGSWRMQKHCCGED